MLMMIDPARRVSFSTVLFLAGCVAAVPARAQGRSTKPAKEPPAAATSSSERPNFAMALQNLKWRDIGPAIMGGRIDDFAVVESDPDIVYVGAASGGVWKTTNAGTTWE